MSSLPGRLAVAAIAEGAAWHTAVAAGAGDGMYINTESLIAGFTVEELLDESVGLTFRQDLNKGNRSGTGTIDLDMRYEGLGPILMALAMGIDTDAVLDTSAFSHKFWDTSTTPDTVPTSLDGVFFTFAQQLDTARVVELPSCKVTGFTITGSKGNVVTASYNIIYDDLIYNGASGTNNTTTIATVTLDSSSIGTRVILDDVAKLEVSTFAANSLAELSITDFTLNLDWNLGGANKLNDSSMGTDEPRSNGYETATLDLTFDVSDSDTIAFVDALLADTKYFGKLTLDSGVIVGATTQTQQWIYEFRHMRAATSPPPSIVGPGKSPASATFTLLSDVTQTETGMGTAFDGPMAIEAINSTSGPGTGAAYIG